MASVRDLLVGYWLISANDTPLARRGRLVLRGAVRAYDDPALQATVLELPAAGVADAIGSGGTSDESSATLLTFRVPENGRGRVQIDVFAETADEHLATSTHWTFRRTGAGTVVVSGADVISSDGTLAPTIAVDGVGDAIVVTATGVLGEEIAYSARLRVLVGPSGLTGEAVGGAPIPAPVVVGGAGTTWPIYTGAEVTTPGTYPATAGLAFLFGGGGAFTLDPMPDPEAHPGATILVFPAQDGTTVSIPGVSGGISLDGSVGGALLFSTGASGWLHARFEY